MNISNRYSARKSASMDGSTVIFDRQTKEYLEGADLELRLNLCDTTLGLLKYGYVPDKFEE